MRNKEIRHLSSSDYISLYIEELAGQHQGGSIQAYDYQQLAKVMKTPTSVFILDYNYLLYIKEGSATMQIDNQARKAGKGSVVFMQAGQVTSLIEVSRNVQGVFVAFEQEVLNAVFTQSNLLALFALTPLLHLPAGTEDTVALLMQLVLKEQEAQAPNMFYACSLIQAVFQKLFEVAAAGRPVRKSYTITLKFKELVHRHFPDSRKVGFYAARLAITENYLNRCISEVLNCTAKTYITTTVISQARLLLQDADQSVADIAYTLNFEDASHFAKVFRKITGLSPVTYRKKYCNEV